MCVCGGGERLTDFPIFPNQRHMTFHRILVIEGPIKLRPVTLVSSVSVLHQVFGELLKGSV